MGSHDIHPTSPPPPPPGPDATDDDSSYIDYETFLSPGFSPYTFAHNLLVSTHDPSDTSLTLTTPLSRVLFDLQEVDTHIHSLTSSDALPLLTYTGGTTVLSTRALTTLEAQLKVLNTAFARLSSAIVPRSTNSIRLLAAVENLHATTTILRDISRALVAARQLDQNLSDNALLRAAQAHRDLRDALTAMPTSSPPRIATELQMLVLTPAEAELTKRGKVGLLDGGALALYVLSPSLCAATVRDSLRNSMSSATTALVRALTSLTMLDRAVGEVVAIRNQVTRLQETLLDAKLSNVVEEIAEGGTGDLRSVFFGGVAEGVEVGVRDVVNRGGANARILKGGRDRVRQALRTCVERDWDGEKGGFESAVMMGAVAILGR